MAATDPFDILPNELIAAILVGSSTTYGRFRLDPHNRWAAARVCRRWRAILAEHGARVVRYVGYVNRRMPWRLLEPFFQGRVLKASVVAAMARTRPLEEVALLSLDFAGCSEIELAKAFVASNTAAGVERALAYVSNGAGSPIAGSGRCHRFRPYVKRDRACRFAHCALLDAAACSGAHRSVAALTQGHRLNSCIRGAVASAIESDRSLVVRVLIRRYRLLETKYALELWRSVYDAEKADGSVVRLLLDAECSFDQRNAVSDPASATSMGALENPWSVGRRRSRWPECLTEDATIAALRLCRERAIAYDAGELFCAAIRRGDPGSCDALIKGEPPEFVDRARGIVHGMIRSRTIGARSISWSLRQAWFEPSAEQVVVMAKIIRTTSPRSGIRPLVDLIERYPSEALLAMVDDHWVDAMMQGCVSAHDAHSARALSEALERCRAADLSGTVAIAPTDLWDRAVDALTKRLSMPGADTRDGTDVRWCYSLLYWMHTLAQRCSRHRACVHMRSKAHVRSTEEYRAWRRVCMPRPLPMAIIESIERDQTDEGRKAMAVVMDLAALASVDQT